MQSPSVREGHREMDIVTRSPSFRCAKYIVTQTHCHAESIVTSGHLIAMRSPHRHAVTSSPCGHLIITGSPHHHEVISITRSPSLRGAHRYAESSLRGVHRYAESIVTRSHRYAESIVTRSPSLRGVRRYTKFIVMRSISSSLDRVIVTRSPRYCYAELSLRYAESIA